MDSSYFSGIRKKLEKTLDEDRFEHTLGVADTSRMLAHLNGEDADKAYLAGLLHDCAKSLSNKEKIKLCEKHNIDISDVEYENPGLLHAKAGAIVAKEEYGIDDEDILNAISSHTTGRPGMSLLEKIVFIADYIEPGRAYRPMINELRALAFADLDKCLVSILECTLKYLGDTAKAIDPMTKLTYEHYSAK